MSAFPLLAALAAIQKFFKNFSWLHLILSLGHSAQRQLALPMDRQ